MNASPARAPATGTPTVVGIEANGTAVCAVVADERGYPLGTGRCGGATPTSYPIDLISDRLAEAVLAALAGGDPAGLRAAVLGIAGISRLAGPSGAPILDQTWRRIGLRCPVRVVADPVAAFAAGSSARRGAVLIADAGSIAAWIEDEAVVARVDGHGWLVGDDASGFWLGRQAVRAVLAELDGRGEPTLLRPAVLGTVAEADHVPGSAADQVALLRSAVYDHPPIELARLAPLVPAAAEAGDRVAQRLVDRTVTLLVAALGALLDELPPRAHAADAPIVLSGTLLASPGRIRREVCRRVAERYRREPAVAGSVAGGAAWLALHSVVPRARPRAHALLTLAGPAPGPEDGGSRLSGRPMWTDAGR
jgi:N-acetylglucosamine kinase-like BadF-type ATPase